MYIKTNLPHEKMGGHTLALFAKPFIRFQKKAGHIVYVNCHVILAKKEGIGEYTFETNWPKLEEKVVKKMRSYAKTLAKQYVQQRGWSFKSKGSKYVQCRSRHGFHFFVN